ncbi:signal peptidase I [Orenia metallireducens]|uniref:Signal peptidase I n=1 Tax=Orenia metallireducens TaxID=1413210 RepID=A0A285HMH0_9FIRM|nr:signal peptidase I [Orenia metallireducens]PRX26655.1 signal peptidase I [Orenia metallireducens]SNY35881.1 signal peptidase I [Orenia metallireducens]
MFKEYLKSIVIALLISFFIITFVVQAFYIPSGSMLPTLKPGDRIFANKFIYRFREPRRQEIIVFKWPVDPKRRFIKRLIGLPGDRVKIVEGQVYVNDKPLEEDYTLERSYTDFPEVKVPEGHYFMLGDNRNNSEDSRFWGFVPQANIVGKAFVIFWPLNRMALIREGN